MRAPAELATSSMRIAAGSAGNVLHRILPGGQAQPEVLTHQATLRRFEHRLGVDGALLKPVVSEGEEAQKAELTDRAEQTVDNMLRKRLVDEATIVELRPIMSADDLYDHDLVLRTGNVMGALRQALAGRRINSMYSTSPILPAEHADSPVTPDALWQPVSWELQCLQRQMGHDQARHLAMLAITPPESMEHFFGAYIPFTNPGPLSGNFLVLERVGSMPDQNRLGRRVNPRHPQIETYSS